MNLEDRLHADLKTLGDSQPVRAADLQGILDKTTARRRRRTVGAGLAAAALITVGAYAGNALIDRVETSAVITADQPAKQDPVENEPVEHDQADDEQTNGETSEGAQADGRAPVAEPAEPPPPGLAPTAAAGGVRITSVAPTADGFVSIGNVDGVPVIERSADGQEWQRMATNGLPDQQPLMSLTPLEDGYLAFVPDERGLGIQAVRSDDLSIWTPVTLPEFENPADGSPRIYSINSVLDGPAGLVVIGSYFDQPTRSPGDLTEPGVPSVVEVPPTSIALLSTDGASSFVTSNLPPINALFGHATDDRYVVVATRADSPTMSSYSSVDGMNWAEQPLLDDAVTGQRPARLSDGTLVRLAHSSTAACCDMQRSTDNGETWVVAATPPDFATALTDRGIDMQIDSVNQLYVGQAGLVTTAHSWPDLPTVVPTFVPDPPAGLGAGAVSVPFEHDTHSGVVEFLPSGDPLEIAAPKLFVRHSDGRVGPITEITDPVVDCCLGGDMHLPLEDGSIITVSVDDIREAGGVETWLSISKAGYVFEVDDPTSPVAFIRLADSSGATIGAWPFVVLNGGEETTGLDVLEGGDLIFTDPVTGERLVTITDAEGDAAAAAAGPPVPEPPPVFDEVAPLSGPPQGRLMLFHSVDGIEWTPLLDEPRVGFAPSVAVGDDEVVVLIQNLEAPGDNQRPVRIPIETN